MMDDRMDEVIERALREDEVIERALKEQVAATEKPNQRRHLTVATLAVAVAMVEVADEIRRLRKAIESRA